jgi:hypothetical protein
VRLALAATVRAEVRVWELPLVEVEKFQITSLGVVAEQLVFAVVRELLENPLAKVVLVGSSTAVIVTGYGFGLLIVATTSPLPPG